MSFSFHEVYWIEIQKNCIIFIWHLFYSSMNFKRTYLTILFYLYANKNICKINEFYSVLMTLALCFHCWLRESPTNCASAFTVRFKPGFGCFLSCWHSSTISKNVLFLSHIYLNLGYENFLFPIFIFICMGGNLLFVAVYQVGVFYCFINFQLCY